MPGPTVQDHIELGQLTSLLRSPAVLWHGGHAGTAAGTQHSHGEGV
jgi:hypothetical protein